MLVQRIFHRLARLGALDSPSAKLESDAVTAGSWTASARGFNSEAQHFRVESAIYLPEQVCATIFSSSMKSIGLDIRV